MVSKKFRNNHPLFDALRFGCGASSKDLEKPLILIESTAGDSHPGSYHLNLLAESAKEGVIENNGLPAIYTCTDTCDGISQGTEGMNYSLLSRDIISYIVEIHALTGHFEGLVLISGCDKAIPAHLLAITRLNLPAIHIPGGVMDPGPSNITLNILPELNSKIKTIANSKDFKFLSKFTCPTPGSCAFLGTACTMQILSEGLGIAMPCTALAPASSFELKRLTREAGAQILELINEKITARKIITLKAIENAMMILTAIGGSTNAILHLAALSLELGFKFKLEQINEFSEEIPYLANIRPSGKHPANFLWYVGGVYKIIDELSEFLHMDLLTVTGLTINENLQNLKKAGYFRKISRFLTNFGLQPKDIISKKGIFGSLIVLTGNIAPKGAVLKKSAITSKFKKFLAPAYVFDSQDEAGDAIIKNKIKPNSVVVIRYEGPKAKGMPEQFFVTAKLSANPKLDGKVALITDGRFSGATRGLCIGHISPEAAERGPISIIQDGDLILIDLERKRIDLVDSRENPCSEKIILERLKKLKLKKSDYTGVLGIYTRSATSACDGGKIV
jgi:dihydroxy-acid dehydratase